MSVGAASSRRVLLLALALKAYGFGVLFLTTPAWPQVEESFVFLERGQGRDERVGDIEERFFDRLGPFDGQWYLEIAGRGYRRLRPSESTRFRRRACSRLPQCSFTGTLTHAR